MSQTDEIMEVVPGRLYGLGASVEVLDRTSWVAPGVSGLQRQSAFLLVEGDEAVLVDCAPAAVSSSVVEQLGQLLSPRRELSVVLSRSEFDTTGALAAIADAFTVTTVYAAGRSNPFDGFQLAAAPAANPGSAKAATVAAVPLKRLAPTDSVAVGSNRTLHVQAAPIRMLACAWFYDSGTRTLFPSDFFGYTVDHPDLSLEDAYRNLAARYWWLPGARTARLARDFDAVFETRDIDTVAPSHGCIFRGADVQREREKVKAVLKYAATQPPAIG